MKKKILFLITLFFSIKIFAFQIAKPELFAQADLSYSANKGIEKNKLFFSSEIGADWEKVNAISGVQFGSDVFDFTIAADFYPEFLNFNRETIIFSIGFGGIYHFQNQFDIALENDLTSLSYFKIATDGDFEFKALLGYGVKISNVYALPSDFGLLWDNNLFLGIFISQKFIDVWEVYCSCKNFDMYRFYLLDMPLHTFGFSYKFNDFKFFNEVEFKFTDQVKSTPCLTGLFFRFSVRYQFK